MADNLYSTGASVPIPPGGYPRPTATLRSLFESLPGSGTYWPREKRDLWLKAVSAALDASYVNSAKEDPYRPRKEYPILPPPLQASYWKPWERAYEKLIAAQKEFQRAEKELFAQRRRKPKVRMTSTSKPRSKAEKSTKTKKAKKS